MKGIVLGNYQVVLNKVDIMDITDFLFENANKEVEIVYNSELEVLLFKTNRTTLVKIVEADRVITISNRTQKFEAAYLYSVLNNILVTELIMEAEVIPAC